MSNDKFYDDVFSYITEHGETGVNILARELKIPLSTMQRYLEKQTYFRKTNTRKWDLPSNVESDIKSNTMTLMVNAVENSLLLLNSQLSEILQSTQNALMPINTLKRAVDGLSAPVAGNSENVDNRLVSLDKKIKETQGLFKKFIDKVPEENRKLLLNLDLVRLTLELGSNFLNSDFNEDISNVLLGKTEKFEESTLELLNEYQNE